MEHRTGTAVMMTPMDSIKTAVITLHSTDYGVSVYYIYRDVHPIVPSNAVINDLNSLGTIFRAALDA